MDWSFTELQDAVREAATPILAAPGDPWEALVEAELVALEGPLETATLLVESGRHGARAPLLETLALGWPAASRRAPGEVLTGGLLEPGQRRPDDPGTVARDGRLYGTKLCVPQPHRAARIVVSAADGVYLACLDDCAITVQTGTHEEPVAAVVLDGAPAERLGGRALLDAWLLRVDLGVSALLLGVAQQALDLTARYTSTREQFGRPIGTFQAVTQRAADAFIDTRAMELTLWQAAWRLDEGLDARREVAIARWWASEGAHRVVSAAQHLHGGMGFDKDYGLYRYYLVAKQWELFLGGAEARLERLGALL